MAVNHFLRERFPSKTWTSIAVLYNPSMPLHRNILNMIGHANHAVALGNFLEGRVWIEDENGQATTVLETKNGQKLLHGTWIDMHDAPVTFNARKYHMLEKHRGNMWALAAYTPQAFKHAAASHINKLVELGFPVPVLQQACQLRQPESPSHSEPTLSPGCVFPSIVTRDRRASLDQFWARWARLSSAAV